MAKDTFKEQFPDYPLVKVKPERSYVGMILIGGTMLCGLAMVYIFISAAFKNDVPVAFEAGYNSQSAVTAKNFAMRQLLAGELGDAIQNFQVYFKLGGTDPEAMAMYASALATSGDRDLALEWSRKAVEADPQSKTVRFIHDALEKK